MDFGKSPALIIPGSDTATSIEVTSPTGTGTVAVTVTTIGGASAASAKDKFTYVKATPGAVVNGPITPAANDLALLDLMGPSSADTAIHRKIAANLLALLI